MENIKRYGAPAATLEPGRKEDESAMEFLRRIVSNCDYEPESILDDLPSVEAIIEFFGLWKTYDTDFLQGIIIGIESGDDPKPYQDFVKKWNLPWRTDFKVVR